MGGGWAAAPTPCRALRADAGSGPADLAGALDAPLCADLDLLEGRETFIRVLVTGAQPGARPAAPAPQCWPRLRLQSRTAAARPPHESAPT